MSSLFNLDAPIWVWMGEVADVIILSLLWWVCCLGIVTIGASTTALYYVLGKKARKESTYVVADFFKSFKANFRQSVPLTIFFIIAAVSCVLYGTMIFDGLVVPEHSESLKFIIPIAILFIFEIVNGSTYLWALLSRFDLPTKQLIKNTFVMMHRHLLTTLVNTVICVAVVFGIVFYPIVFIVAPGVIVWAQSFLLQRIFTSYIEADKVRVEELEAAMSEEDTEEDTQEDVEVDSMVEFTDEKNQ